MPAARQAVERQDSREVTRPGSPTYQMASWSSAVATAAATALLQLAIWYVGDPGRVTSLESWRSTAWRAAGIHGLIALTYWLWPKKTPSGGAGAGQDAGTDREKAVR